MQSHRPEPVKTLFAATVEIEPEAVPTAPTHSCCGTELGRMADFSDDHVDRRVVAQSGAELGTVEDVRDGDLHVAVEPDADADAISELGWDTTVNQDVHRLPDQYVSNVTENAVRLRV
jgi:hypothetical protein